MASRQNGSSSHENQRTKSWPVLTTLSRTSSLSSSSVASSASSPTTPGGRTSKASSSSMQFDCSQPHYRPPLSQRPARLGGGPEEDESLMRRSWAFDCDGGDDAASSASSAYASPIPPPTFLRAAQTPKNEQQPRHTTAVPSSISRKKPRSSTISTTSPEFMKHVVDMLPQVSRAVDARTQVAIAEASKRNIPRTTLKRARSFHPISPTKKPPAKILRAGTDDEGITDVFSPENPLETLRRSGPGSAQMGHSSSSSTTSSASISLESHSSRPDIVAPPSLSISPTSCAQTTGPNDTNQAAMPPPALPAVPSKMAQHKRTTDRHPHAPLNAPNSKSISPAPFPSMAAPTNEVKIKLHPLLEQKRTEVTKAKEKPSPAQIPPVSSQSFKPASSQTPNFKLGMVRSNSNTLKASGAVNVTKPRGSASGSGSYKVKPFKPPVLQKQPAHGGAI